MADDQQESVTERSQLEALKREVASTTHLMKEILKLNGRLTKAMEDMIRLDTKVSEVSGAQVEIQNMLAKQQTSLDLLMSWHNNQKAVRSALGWMIDKAPTLAAITVFCFWVLNQWSNKEGGK